MPFTPPQVANGARGIAYRAEQLAGVIGTMVGRYRLNGTPRQQLAINNALVESALANSRSLAEFVDVEEGEPGLAYDPAADTWRFVPGLPRMTRGALWSGEAIVGYSERLPRQPIVPRVFSFRP